MRKLLERSGSRLTNANRANEHTTSSNKKTIMPDDVFKALEDVEFGFMRPKLEAEFQSKDVDWRRGAKIF
jgi:hypothetical protein